MADASSLSKVIAKDQGNRERADGPVGIMFSSHFNITSTHWKCVCALHKTFTFVFLVSVQNTFFVHQLVNAEMRLTLREVVSALSRFRETGQLIFFDFSICMLDCLLLSSQTSTKQIDPFC
jgi:hypothetical protein